MIQGRFVQRNKKSGQGIRIFVLCAASFRLVRQNVDDFAFGFGRGDFDFTIIFFAAVGVSFGHFFAVKRQVATVFQGLTAFQTDEVEKLGVGKMGGNDVLQGGEHRFNATGEAFVPIAQHIANDLALQVGLRAAEVARDNRELFQFGVFNQIFFFHICQRADDDVFAVVAHQFRRHGFEFAAVKHIQEHGGEDVVAVVSQGDFGAAQFFCSAIENTAAQTAAQ